MKEILEQLVITQFNLYHGAYTRLIEELSERGFTMIPAYRNLDRPATPLVNPIDPQVIQIKYFKPSRIIYRTIQCTYKEHNLEISLTEGGKIKVIVTGWSRVPAHTLRWYLRNYPNDMQNEVFSKFREITSSFTSTSVEELITKLEKKIANFNKCKALRAKEVAEGKGVRLI